MALQIPQGGTLHASAQTAIPPPTLERQRAVDAVAAYLQMLRDLPQTRFGVIGDGFGNVDVPDRAKFFYVRLGDADGEVAEARSLSLLNPADGDIVLLRKERPGGTGSWVILEWYGTGLPPLVLCANDCTGVLALQSRFIYDTNTLSGVVLNPGGFFPDGNIVYATAQRSNGSSAAANFYTIDVTNPASPSIAATLAITGTSVVGTFQHMWKYANFVYVSEPTSGVIPGWNVYVVDVSTPTSPTLAFTWNFTTFRGTIIKGFASGGNLYLITDYVTNISTDRGFKILDITNPASPSVIATQDASGTTKWDRWDYAGGYFYGVNASGLLEIYDVTTPSSPVAKGTVSTPDQIEDIHVDGHYAWLVNYSNQLVGVDVTDPNAPTVISTTSLSYFPAAVDVCGNFVYVADEDSGLVEAYDISTPSAPVLNSSDSVPTFRTNPYFIQIDNGRVYIVGRQSTFPSNPILGIFTA